ncbi:acetylserotonin O-methyltransferase [Castor canadensis]|uniref:Acetylserotonin O-methyltransferase n=1 Tax=Castor canadensis TaxID=51338 RepID=A0AC58LTT4_CASCN
MSSLDDQDFCVLNKYASGFMVSQVIFAACELGVFDVLAKAQEPLDSEAIAGRLDCSRRGTELLLDACVSLGLLQVDVRSGAAYYRNSDMADTYLATGSPKTQCHMLRYLGTTTYRCWGHLPEAIREGKNQYMKAFGVPADQLFAAIYRSEDERLRFMRGLQDIWSVCGTRVVTAFDLSTFPVICDLGGGSGALAKACVSVYPKCKVTVFDIPEVVGTARTHFSFPEEGRISFCEGDFFEDHLPEADLYVLARVLHDWPDDRCSHLLARVHHACKPGGGILVVETVLDEGGRGPLSTLLCSLNMLLQTEGRERTEAQFRALLSSAGFCDIQLRRTGGTYDAILGRKESCHST